MNSGRGSVILLAAALLAAVGCTGAPVQQTAPTAVPSAAIPALEAPRDLVLPPPAEPPLPVPAPALPTPEASERVTRPDATPEREVPSPADRSAEERGFVVRDRVNLRPCPDEAEACGAVAALRMNEEVRVLGQQDGWLHVRVPRLNRDGYVARRLIAPRPISAPPPATLREERPSPQVTSGKEGGRSVTTRAGRTARLPEEELLQ